MSSQTFQVVVASVLAATGALMLAHALLRPDYRRRPVLFGATANMLGALFWFASVAAVGTPDRVQTVLGSLRALPVDAALAYICHLLVRSVGNKHPGLIGVLAVGRYVLPATPFVMAFVCGVWFPQPAIQSSAPGTAELLVPRVRSLVEIFFLATSTVVFFKEALSDNPGLVRFQNAFLSVAGVALLTSFGSSIAIAIERAFGGDHPVLGALLEPTETTLLINIALAGCAYIVGIVLYYSAEERERLLHLYRVWIKQRYAVEAELQSVYGDGFGDNDSGDEVHAYLKRAASSLGISATRSEQSRLTVGILGFMIDPNKRHLITKLERTHHELLKHPIFGRASFVVAHVDRGIRYDIHEDLLHLALNDAYFLLNVAPYQGADREPPPEHIQLAAALAADIGPLLAEPLRSDIFLGASPIVPQKVLAAYHQAKRDEKLSRKRAS